MRSQPLLDFSKKVYARLLVLYPRAHRLEYGPHMAQLFRDCAGDSMQQAGMVGLLKLWISTLFDLLKTVTEERIKELIHMERQKLYLLPSAYIPFALSLVSLALVLRHVALYGTARQADEGAAAHLFQIFMIVQLPIAAYFAIKWLPRKTKQALFVLSLQALAYFAAFGALYWYEVLSQVH